MKQIIIEASILPLSSEDIRHIVESVELIKINNLRQEELK